MSVHDCVNQERLIITRWPKEEKPSQARLILIFREGLQNKTLHAHLYERRHMNLNESFHDATDYDDSFDVSSLKSHENKREVTLTKISEFGSSTLEEFNAKEIVGIMFKKTGQVYRPSYKQQKYTPQPVWGLY